MSGRHPPRPDAEPVSRQ